MAYSIKDILKFFSPKRVAIPIVLGLLAISYMLYNSLSEPKYDKTENGNYAWQDLNLDKVKQFNEFVPVEPGTGQYRLITFSQALSSVNWSWQIILWIIISFFKL